jgi:hypothetical protein
MLVITIGGVETFDEETNQFSSTKKQEVSMEHSLVAVSKWESKYNKPFLSKENKTVEETRDYIFFMIKTPGVTFETISSLSDAQLMEINDYVASDQSATTFGNMPSRSGVGEIITSELIYYWMVAFNIPWDCQKWHINRLFALIRICNIKQQPNKKMPRHEVAARNAELNAKRKAEHKTKG